MNKLFKLVLGSILVSSLLAGCSTSVERIDAGQTVDLSGAWNDTDSQMVAQEMISDALARPWYSNFAAKTGKAPAVIVGSVRNLSHEHINTKTFVNEMERELINSGRVEFVASSDERSEIREERIDQDLNSSESTRKAAGQEKGADFILKGQINTILDTASSEQVRYYQVDLSLISLADNRKVWVGQKKLKKLVSNGKLRY
ncbi:MULTISPECIES: penicillin-binding protein activator LpoB [unclassified Moritella]|uniref:penicillin-binding protein activator LpoB n=1 Tax=unclassified Moritella TaxID=2637987 RepID=UPI001BACDF49|nr:MULTISPECIES: penicillin-binding protein activator LpoB [unclassified Moritella]QUM82476.1 penicillin-binding protein activator LpoB [Moritella sp. 5]QUM86779.1 penicillin-binding protein activator LpoB [Moritella sp. 28]QUM91006.1 penicillin-binding protein activator LpoB [Moritella sp. 36]